MCKVVTVLYLCTYPIDSRYVSPEATSVARPINCSKVRLYVICLHNYHELTKIDLITVIHNTNSMLEVFVVTRNVFKSPLTGSSNTQ